MEQSQSHDSLADVGTGTGNLPACDSSVNVGTGLSDLPPVYDSGSSSDTNAHSHSTIRMSAGVSLASDSQVSRPPVGNTHPMVTRAKAGVYKSKVLNVEAIEPTTIEEALATVEWCAAAQDEYDALMRPHGS